MGAGLRPTTKGVEKPPDPKVRAPVLDPTGSGGEGSAPLTDHNLGGLVEILQNALDFPANHKGNTYDHRKQEY